MSTHESVQISPTRIRAFDVMRLRLVRRRILAVRLLLLMTFGRDVRGRLPVAGAPSNEPRVAAMDMAKGIAGLTLELPFWKEGWRLMRVCVVAQVHWSCLGLDI
jgi:hypothetical protein